jgi:hypothetical protein
VAPLVWHYAKGFHEPRIMSDGIIRPASLYVPENEKPIVWFSTNQRWERMVSAVDGSLMEKLVELYGGLVRIGVEETTALLHWEQLKQLSGMNTRTARLLEKRARRILAQPREWRGTFDAVPASLWRSVEDWKDGSWVPRPDA